MRQDAWGTSGAERHWKRVVEVDRIRDMGFEPESTDGEEAIDEWQTARGWSTRPVAKSTMEQYKTGEEENRRRCCYRSETSTRQIMPIWKGIPWLLGQISTHQDVATVLRKSLDTTNHPPNGITRSHRRTLAKCKWKADSTGQMEVHISEPARRGSMDDMGRQRNHQVTSYPSDDNIR